MYAIFPFQRHVRKALFYFVVVFSHQVMEIKKNIRKFNGFAFEKVCHVWLILCPNYGVQQDKTRQLQITFNPLLETTLLLTEARALRENCYTENRSYQDETSTEARALLHVDYSTNHKLLVVKPKPM